MTELTKLFIGGFPLDMTELEIVQLVALYAEVRTIKVVRDKKTKICKGYAFLETADQSGAELAIATLDGTLVAGRELRLSIVAAEEAAATPVIVRTRSKRPRVQRARI
ncbi:RNA recognition motif domain-containing protein [Mucilaginibacter sp. UYCu711]|uniref:RNA recognition motif domain-containing protein n=1 Tax=Mucilaginibacter sp. UYCu711 TaxID=3156339 RepID=UPI003D1C91FE